MRAVAFNGTGSRISPSSAGADCSFYGVERPFVGGRIERAVPLQLEVPGLDEVMWAKADVVFDTVVASRSPQAGPFGLLRRTGYRIAIAAARDLRLLRDYVFESYRSQIDAYNAKYASTMRSAL